MKSKQFSLLNLAGLRSSGRSAYGGDLLRTRAGRSTARPLSTRETMHLVLRSTQAKGDWSFRSPKYFRNIQRIVESFGVRFGVRVISMANVGNHLHLQIKLGNRFTYAPFIRAVSGAIAMAVTGRTRWVKTGTAAANQSSAEMKSVTADAKRSTAGAKPKKFWDYRPFTRIITSLRGYLNLQDYIRINQFEGCGYRRQDARFMLNIEKRLKAELDW